MGAGILGSMAAKANNAKNAVKGLVAPTPAGAPKPVAAVGAKPEVKPVAGGKEAQKQQKKVVAVDQQI